MTTVDIILPTMHKMVDGQDLYKQCLESLRATIGDKQGYSLITVENVRGYAQAINKGLAESDPKNDVVLLNDDILFFHNDWLNRLTNYGKGDIRGCKLIYPNNVIQHVGGDLRQDFVGFHPGQGAMNLGQYEQARKCTYITSAVAYIKREVIDRVGPMATNYGVGYFVDVDYCLAAIREGFSVWYNPVTFTHLESVTLGPMSRQNNDFGMAYSQFCDRWGNDETLDMLREYFEF
jgi:GT2 family glycosyltransferase